jgi:hypothetical protein
MALLFGDERTLYRGGGNLFGDRRISIFADVLFHKKDQKRDRGNPEIGDSIFNAFNIRYASFNPGTKAPGLRGGSGSGAANHLLVLF